ncbi:MAG: LysM domain-containing protein, partial [Moraxellaceae bacterium]
MLQDFIQKAFSGSGKELIMAALKEHVSDTERAEIQTEHVVKPGETLGGVAQRAEVPRVLIIEANRLTAP